jgi:carboxypeptidase C (cathepsin A)
MMKNLLLSLCFGLPLLANAQQKKAETVPSATATPKAEEKSQISNSRILNPDMSVVTNGEVTVKGQKVPYKTTAGTIPVWDEAGKIIASCFYTYYERSDVKDKSTRPIVFSFNGGPGSASVWMHIAYTGPKVLNIDDEGYPVQPYGYKDNPYSILDVADIIFIDPVNTGFSRIINAETPKSTFFGVKADIKYLSEWLNTFVSRVNRWSSPKYLIGESYGTNRVSGMALELQSSHWMYLNGVVLVSPTDLGIKRDETMGDALRLPYFAAVAWYHKALEAPLQSKDLTTFLPEVEDFTVNQLIPALAKGGYLPENEKKATQLFLERIAS